MHVEPHHTIQELQTAAKKEKRARVAHRVRAVILALQGHTAPQIAGLLGSARRAVQQWIKWYNDQGLEGLPDGPRTGHPKKLSPQQEQQLCAWLDAGPPQDGPVCTYRGPQVHAHITSCLGVKLSLSAAYETLHRLGYEPLRPRPRHRKTDPAAQEDFKKSAPLLWTNSGASSRGGSSRSGTRTKRVWASRAR
jgi:transposase